MTYICDKVTLYLQAKDYSLKKYGKVLQVYKGEEKIQNVPIIKIKDIVIYGSIGLTSGIISLCQSEKVNVHFMTGNGKYLGSMTFDPAKNIFIRLNQYKKHCNPTIKLALARDIVRGKIKNQQYFLDSFRKGFKLSMSSLDNTKNIDEVLGIEGSTTQNYFKFWDEIVKNRDFKFVKRSRRPPENEINALLSLCYSVLANEIHSLINIVGLDPYIGFLHQNYYGRPSLASDLIEEWRPIIADKFVINLVNRNEFVRDDFEMDENNIEYSLKQAGFRKFFEKWTKYFKEDEHYSEIFQRNINYYKAVELQIRMFLRYILDEEERYTSYYLK